MLTRISQDEGFENVIDNISIIFIKNSWTLIYSKIREAFYRFESGLTHKLPLRLARILCRNHFHRQIIMCAALERASVPPIIIEMGCVHFFLYPHITSCRPTIEKKNFKCAVSIVALGDYSPCKRWTQPNDFPNSNKVYEKDIGFRQRKVYLTFQMVQTCSTRKVCPTSSFSVKTTTGTHCYGPFSRISQVLNR